MLRPSVRPPRPRLRTLLLRLIGRCLLVCALPTLGLLFVVQQADGGPGRGGEVTPVAQVAPAQEAPTAASRERARARAASRGRSVPLEAVVTVFVRGAAVQALTDADSVRGLLEELEVALDPLDQVTPALDAPVADGMSVRIERVEVEERVVAERLPHEVVTEPTDAREQGEEVVAVEGRDGELEIRERIVRVDGFEQSREVVDERVVAEPVEEVVEVGTAPPAPPPEPVPEPTPEPPPERETRAARTVDGSVWDSLAQCESGGRWSLDSGSGYSGGLQFHDDTWATHGGHEFAPSAHEATREQQITVAERVVASQGWQAWPACASRLGLH